MVESVTNSGNGWTETYSYTYDANVNITQIYKGNTLIHAYTYDSLNQLTQDIDYTAGTTTTYTYDRGGNILSSLKVNTATNATLESHTYSYTNSNWKDQLTAFDGNPITYDANGNPLTYNGMTLTWTQGRRLASISGTGLSASYSYNENGIRVSKTVNGVTTNYLLDGTRIIKQSDGTDVLWYYYDATGSVVSFDLNGTPYYYVKNLQGDILAITNASGQKVVEYSYDAWGKVESITGSLVGTVGAKNPFRYRGYYYDAETEWYYLFNRYYYPGAYRWISADEYCSTSQTLVEQNMFNYCGNNPLFRKDSSGDFWEAIVVGFLVGVVSQYVSDVVNNIASGKTGFDIFEPTSDPVDYIASGVGAAIAAIPGLGAVGTVVAGAAGNVVTEGLKGNIKNIGDLAISAGTGAAASIIGLGVSKAAAYGKVKMIENSSRTVEKQILRDEIFKNGQAYVNENLKTFAASSLSQKIALVEGSYKVFQIGAYSSSVSAFSLLFME